MAQGFGFADRSSPVRHLAVALMARLPGAQRFQPAELELLWLATFLLLQRSSARVGTLLAVLLFLDSMNHRPGRSVTNGEEAALIASSIETTQDRRSTPGRLSDVPRLLYGAGPNGAGKPPHCDIVSPAGRQRQPSGWAGLDAWPAQGVRELLGYVARGGGDSTRSSRSGTTGVAGARTTSTQAPAGADLELSRLLAWTTGWIRRCGSYSAGNAPRCLAALLQSRLWLWSR